MARYAQIPLTARFTARWCLVFVQHAVGVSTVYASHGEPDFHYAQSDGKPTSYVTGMNGRK